MGDSIKFVVDEVIEYKKYICVRVIIDLEKRYKEAYIKYEKKWGEELAEGDFFCINELKYEDIFKGIIKKDIFYALLKFKNKNNPYNLKVEKVRCIKEYEKELLIKEKDSVDDSQNKGSLQLYFLNVGQGDSTLIVTPGKKVYLVDTNYLKGRKESILKEIKRILLKYNLGNRLNGIFITHKHIDHIRGVEYILDEFDVENIFMNNIYEHYTKASELLIKKINEKNTDYIELNKNFSIKEAGFNIDILNCGITKSQFKDVNDSSILMKIFYKESNIYLMGDASKNIIYNVFGKGKIGKSNLIKISHHGSKTGTDSIMMSKFKITHAYISVGKNNRYGHPHKEVMDELIGIDTKISEKYSLNSVCYCIKNNISICNGVCCLDSMMKNVLLKTKINSQLRNICFSQKT
ncbi:MBL fold metallo-hydrolase [uncultured Clostridium sp.]|jgi:beta-lactamase superfamily II metal-dependent hydrolase|uniref:ComEC/Rec2 family competence protein n=1 Tax=uncultured Clostridium sp. TaxID=59620 RepID=UPI002604F688|nr:MBL fold metallo-hydrolase [uncultured Clostridium sp.]